MQGNDDEWEEREAAERYPWLYGGEEDHYKPPALEPKYQKILDLERAKLAARNEVAYEHGKDYHNLKGINDAELPGLNFRRYDNLFLAKPAGAFLRAAGPEAGSARRLFSDLWLEGELGVLFADTGCGKSLLAMQIARALAGGPQFGPFAMDVEPARVAYFDFELTDLQFAKRYSSRAPSPADEDVLFPENLIRCPPQLLSELPPGFDDHFDFLINSIVDLVEYLKARVVVIDNITWLSSGIESSRAALRLMKTLVHLKNTLGISILVLAHTPKRYTRSPITVSHLQGSKMLSNFADSIFAMGVSRRGRNVRYLKGIKHRNSAARETAAEVATLRIGRSGRFLGFTFEGYADERAHIGWSYGEASADRPEFVKQVEELALRQLTQREIAEELGVSQTTINRCLKAKNDGEAPVSL